MRHFVFRGISRIGNQGFTMLEMLVAGGVMTVMALGFASMATNSAKSQKSANLMLEMTSLQSLLTSTLASDVSCKGAFPTGQTINTDDTTTFGQISFAGKTLSTSPPNNVYNGWTLQSLKLSKAIFAQDIVNGASSMKLYDVDLLMRFVKTNDQLGTAPKDLSIPIKILTKAGNPQIEACAGESDLMISACTSLGGVYTKAAAAGALGTCEPATPLSGSMKKIVDSAVNNAGTKLCASMGAGYISASQKCDYGNGGTKTFAEYIKEIAAASGKVDGGWSAVTWGQCLPCAAGATTGNQTGTRVCNNPAPSGGGASCAGSATLAQACTCTKYNVGSCKGTCNLTKTEFYGTFTFGGKTQSCAVTLAALGLCSVDLWPPAGSTTNTPTTELQGSCTVSKGQFQADYSDEEQTSYTVVKCIGQYKDTCTAKCTATNSLVP